MSAGGSSTFVVRSRTMRASASAGKIGVPDIHIDRDSNLRTVRATLIPRRIAVIAGLFEPPDLTYLPVPTKLCEGFTVGTTLSQS